jgi:hypothetical protein
MFNVDAFVEDEGRAHEIKWREATTSSDHVNKEIAKARAIADAGYTPIRVTFYEPIHETSIATEAQINNVYRTLGEVYLGDDAWHYVHEYTGVDLRKVIGFTDPISPASWHKTPSRSQTPAGRRRKAAKVAAKC